jgi:hypothetical protein
MIGATLEVGSPDVGGTEVTCSLHTRRNGKK